MTLQDALLTAVSVEAGVILVLFRLLAEQWKARHRDAERFLLALKQRPRQSSNPPDYSTPATTSPIPPSQDP